MWHTARKRLKDSTRMPHGSVSLVERNPPTIGPYRSFPLTMLVLYQPPRERNGPCLKSPPKCQVLASQTYPVNEWLDLGTFTAKFLQGEQTFEIPQPAFARCVGVISRKTRCKTIVGVTTYVLGQWPSGTRTKKEARCFWATNGLWDCRGKAPIDGARVQYAIVFAVMGVWHVCIPFRCSIRTFLMLCRAPQLSCCLFQSNHKSLSPAVLCES